MTLASIKETFQGNRRYNKRMQPTGYRAVF